MRHNKASLYLSALLVLAGCDPDKPDNTPKLNGVTVTCDPSSVKASQSAQCTASATDQNGQPFSVSSYSWTSSDESVAKVDATGKVTTLTVGTATLSASATANGVTKQGQTTFTVNPPTTHATPVTAAETWRVADNPHLVRGNIEVNGAGAPTLTIEAGVELRFEQDSGINVTNGTLHAMGTPQAPIRMVANQSEPTKGYWRGVVFAATGSASEMNHTTLSDCGSSTGAGACIRMENQAAPVLRNVTVRNSGTAGVAVANDGSAFGTDSTTLSISGSMGYAVRIGSDQAGTLPTGGNFTGNTPDAVELQGDVLRSQTWPKLGIPYVASTRINVASAANPELILLSGTEVRFNAGVGLWIGDGQPGALIADGTAAAPIRFVPNLPTPSKGYWRGLHFWRAGDSKLNHVLVSHAGSNGGIDEGNNGTANLNVYRESGAFVTNSTFSDSSGCGVAVTDGAYPGTNAVTTNFTSATYNNTFVNNADNGQCIIP